MSTAANLSFAPLSASAREEFADARNFIAGVAVDLTEGRALTQTEADVPVLQAIIDHPAMKRANFEAWVALGIAFGDVLTACIPELAWCLVTDDEETYAGLQFGKKAVSVAAPTMLWKRANRGEKIDVAFMIEDLKSLFYENSVDYRDA